MRLSLNITNVANHRQRVRDADGVTPLQYQPGYRDPLGRDPHALGDPPMMRFVNILAPVATRLATLALTIGLIYAVADLMSAVWRSFDERVTP
jgi:hypothetical protein